MATIPISFTASLPIASASITTLVRATDNTTPAGVSLPIALTAGTPVGSPLVYPYTGSFVDASPAANYDATLSVTRLSGVVETQAFEIPYAAVQRSGTYWTQAGVTAIFGAYNIAIWSQKQNDTDTLDTTALQSAGSRTDRAIDRLLRDHNYVSPLPSTSADFGQFSDAANLMVAVRLYQGRPGTDTGTTLDGAMADAARQAANSLRSMLRSTAGIDATRRSSPAVSISDPMVGAQQAGYPIFAPGWQGTGGVPWWW